MFDVGSMWENTRRLRDRIDHGQAALAGAASRQLLDAGVDGVKVFMSSPRHTLPEDAVRAAPSTEVDPWTSSTPSEKHRSSASAASFHGLRGHPRQARLENPTGSVKDRMAEAVIGRAGAAG